MPEYEQKGIFLAFHSASLYEIQLIPLRKAYLCVQSGRSNNAAVLARYFLTPRDRDSVFSNSHTRRQRAGSSLVMAGFSCLEQQNQYGVELTEYR